MAKHTFPCGAKVLVDGRDLAIVKQAFPEGSSSFLFPHYKLDFVDGDQNVAVAMSRVGVERADRRLATGDIVRRSWPNDGSARAGKASGPRYQVLKIKDHKPGDGPRERNAIAVLSDGSWDFVWNLLREETKAEGLERLDAHSASPEDARRGR